MIECTRCQAENLVGAKFCKECGGELPSAPVPTVPLSPKATIPVAKEPLSRLDVPTQPIPNPATRPIEPFMESNSNLSTEQNELLSRPPGAIFGDQFLYKSLVFSDDHQVRYLVKQIHAPIEQRIQVCSNPECGALYPSGEDDVQKFCTDCGSTLGSMEEDLVLIETLAAVPDTLKAITAKKLSHPSIRGPLVVFEEPFFDGLRHCMVIPLVSELRQPDASQGLRWGVDLAKGLEFLHHNDINFNGEIDQACFAMDQERAVWANFTCNHILVNSGANGRHADVQSLARVIFRWLTGKTEYRPDPNLTMAENQVFETALEEVGFASAAGFANALEEALEQIVSQRSLDLRLGRRTHVGALRELNEDSLLTIELNRTLQSISQPLGLYVVADGMGGHTAGEIASGTIVNTMLEKVLKGLIPSVINQGAAEDCLDWLREAVLEANAAVYQLRVSSDTDMGSTIVAAIIQGNQAYIAHVGDSRAYMINSRGIKRITTDHSLVERLIATNQITPEEARIHPQRNVIYRTIGDKKDVDVETSTHTMQVNDYLLICSDGLTGLVDDRTIQHIVLELGTPQEACDLLVDTANSSGGDDNITVIVVQLVQT